MQWRPAQAGATADTSVLTAKVRRPTSRGLWRDRCISLVCQAWDHRIALVAAPAGFGKTTLLTQLASVTPSPVAWYRPEATDDTEESLLSHLARSFSMAFGTDVGPWHDLPSAVADLDAHPPEPMLLVVDDEHVVHGTAAEAALGRFVEYSPPWLHVVAAGRRPPRWNLSRLRVSGDLLEIGADDLRFRPWEVELLFTTVYRSPLPPEDVAELTRRTEGWAANLQLFQLATAGKPLDERRRTVAALTTRSRLVREYLTRNVLDDLPEELRRFLVDTCVLGRLSPSLCDRFLDREGSRAVLDELRARQLFLTSAETDDDGDTLRYHEALRSHLEDVLVDQVGAAHARARFRRAATLLEDDGMAADALRASCLAEDWETVARLLRRRGDELAGTAEAWLDTIPEWLLADDPGVLLAIARRYAASGRWHDAADTYRRAQAAAGTGALADVCRVERLNVAGWLDPASVARPGWAGHLRLALTRDPLEVERRAATEPGPYTALVRGLSALLGGHTDRARDLLGAAAIERGAPPAVQAAARLAAAAATDVAGPLEDGDRHRIAREVADVADALPDLPWLDRVTRAAAALSGDPGGLEASAAAGMEADVLGDPWGGAVASWCRAVGLLRAGSDARDQADDAFRRCTALGAGTLAAWADAARALALVRRADPRAGEAARAAVERADASAVPGARSLALAALEQSESARGMPDAAAAAPRPGAVRVTALGAFGVLVDGRPLDLAGVKPRARSALHLLAAWPGRPVHAETIIDALWPTVDVPTGKRNLQVAISSLRRVLQEGTDRAVLLRREGNAYVLTVQDSGADVAVVEEAAAEGRAHLRAGDRTAARAAFTRALGAYGGELLPEEGPAEWVVERRHHLRTEAVEAARAIAELALDDDARTAVSSCERGLSLDRFDDGLWQLLIRALAEAGEPAAAECARREYRGVLAELGLAADDDAGDGQRHSLR